MNSELLCNKNILIMGLRNKWSIAWGIANAVKNSGANVIITYHGEREKSNAEHLANILGNADICQCDITLDEEIDNLFNAIKEKNGVIHGLVHSIAFAKTEDLKTDFINTSRDGFKLAMDVSVYSLVAISKRVKDLMDKDGSIITLTYIGAEKVFPGYNIMGIAKSALGTSVKYLANDLGSFGIRINAISAGPIKTLSAKGITNFNSILETVERKAPLKKCIEQDEIGNSALYLLSNMSKGVTGEIIHVDCGYNIMGI